MAGWALPLFLAQQNNDAAAGAIAGLFGGTLCLFELAIIVLVYAGWWKTFVKAGEPGWAAIVPIYNLMIMAKIAGKEMWWGLLCLIPCIGLIFFIMICIEFAKKFGKDAVFGVLLALFGFIFFPILGFGDAKYQSNAS